MKQEEIEMQLWDYIDGSCDDVDRERISVLINTDAAWKEIYAELIALQERIAGIEPEHPSLRFTKNVMEAVSTVQIGPAAKKYMNINVIRGIAALFIVMLVCAVGYSMAVGPWETVTGGNLARLNLNGLFNNSFFSAILFVNIVLGLALIDLVLRKRRLQNLR